MPEKPAMPSPRAPQTATQTENPALTLGRDLVVLAHKWRRALARHMLTLGISDAQWSILDSLNRSGDGIHQHQLASRLGLDRSAVVRVLGDMEKAGLTSRRANAQDARVKEVFLTPEGRSKAESVYEVIRSVEDPLLAMADPTELQMFSDLIGRFSRHLDTLQDH